MCRSIYSWFMKHSPAILLVLRRPKEGWMTWHLHGSPGRDHMAWISISCLSSVLLCLQDHLNAIPQTANFHQSVIYIKNCLQILNDRKNENTLVRTKRYRRRPVKRTAGCGKELQKIAFTFTLCPPWDSQPVLRVNKPIPVMEDNRFFRGHKSSDILNSLKWEWDRGVNSTSSRLVWWARL